jgi:hypothetical protein
MNKDEVETIRVFKDDMARKMNAKIRVVDGQRSV